jgi:flavin-dependent dehydrogenase
VSAPAVDLVVVGGGPVGLSTALGARLAGLSVALLEPRGGAVDKACGEGLMPSSLASLQRLGVDPVGMPFHGIRYVAGGRQAEARFSGPPGRGVRRTTLVSALHDRCDDVGVRRLTGRATEVRQDAAGVTAGGVSGRYLAVADGLHSPLRRSLGLGREARGHPRYGLRRHFRRAPWTDLVEVHWARDAEAYVTPVAPDVVGVAVLCGGGEAYDGWLRRFPALAERLGDAEPVTPVRGAGPLRQAARQRVAGRVLLAGDAAGYVDALTGEGLAVGLASAEALVRAVLADDPAGYEREWRRVTRRSRLLTEGLLRATRLAPVRSALVPAASGLPGVFRTTVNALA